MTNRHRPASPRRDRRRPAWRPEAVAALEGRALLSLSPFDPTFHGGVAVVSPAVADATSPNTASAVAVDSEGRIVVAAVNVASDFSTGPDSLSVLRFNADGSVDTTFGTAGRAAITLPAAAFNRVAASRQVLVQPDDKIILAATLSATVTTPDEEFPAVGTAVIRLNADGTPDATFGTGGEVLITAGHPGFQDLALQPDGKVVLGGTSTPVAVSPSVAAVTRLNADGSADATFNGGAILNLDPALYGTTNSLAAVLVKPTGQVDAVWTNSALAAAQVVQLKADGTIDAAFGAGGISRTPTTSQAAVTAAAVQPDGKIVFDGGGLRRLNADGTVDATFAAPTDSIAANAIVILPDGAIVVGSSTRAPLNGEFSVTDTAFAVARFSATGAPDRTFGPNGTIRFGTGSPGGNVISGPRSDSITGLALTRDGQVIAAGSAEVIQQAVGRFGTATFLGSQVVVAQLKPTNLLAGGAGDYDGDNTSDLAVYLPTFGTFAIAPSGGTPAYFAPFGSAGPGGSIPVTGDFDGDGKTDIAVYLPAFGAFAIEPSSGAPAYFERFGSAGAGASIPAVGDFDGDGKTDIAVYLPAFGTFAVEPSSGAPAYFAAFGSAGPGGSIPAVGDYDGDGKADLAVYLPAAGAFAIQPSGGGQPYLNSFGPVGAGQAIPAPGDYDGDAYTDEALYLPASGTFAIRPHPHFGAVDRSFAFGSAGSGASIPAPGNYNGYASTDFAVYLPASGSFAYLGSIRAVGQIQPFGTAGPGQTLPATSIPAARPPIVAAATLPAPDASAGVLFALTDDLLPPGTRKKR